ncbi:MAG: hypothetical protein K2F59_00240 [Eubacteriales bacterium]|nr:hypothetical protein [Eubacteriales bacterium]
MQEYTRVDDLIEDLYEVIEEHKGGGFFGGKSFDKKEAIEILEDIRNNLPRELKDANKVLKNANKIIEDAEYEAKRIIKMAEEKAEFLASEHNIIRIAEEKAQIARKEASEFYIGTKTAAINYADASMSHAEKALQNSLEEIAKIFKYMEERLSLEIDAIYEDRQQMKEMEGDFISEIEQIFKDR